MGPLALFLCLVFIAWLLVRDFKRRTSVSTAIWIPTFMLLTLGSKTPSYWFGLPNTAAVNQLDQVFFLFIIFGSWIVASWRGVKWSKLLTTNTAITLFYVYFFISPLWSARPSDSLTRVLKDFGTTLLVISVILSEKDPLQAVRAAYVRCACVLFPLSVLFFRYSYLGFGWTYARNGDPTYTGVAVQKNSLGEMALVFCLFLIWDYLETRPAGAQRLWDWSQWDYLVLMLIGAWLLYMSQSKTSLVCLLIGLPLMIGGEWLSSRVISKMVLLGALSLPFFTFFTPQFRSIIAPLLGALGRDATLTGRTDVWQYITSTTVNPIVGAGFWNFWTGEDRFVISEAHQGYVLNAHNGYLDIYLDGGLIGLVLLFCLLFASGKRLIGNLHVNRYQRVRYAFLIIAIINNLTESLFARPSMIWFTTLLVLVEFPSLKSYETFGHNAQDQSNGACVVEAAS